MITCFLCQREWPKDKAHHVERGYWACGEPRHCHEYVMSAAAQTILRSNKPPRYKTDPGGYQFELNARRL